MAICNDEAPTITPPDVPLTPTKETIMTILGVEEIEISKEDVNGDVVTLIVLGRVKEETP